MRIDWKITLCTASTARTFCDAETALFACLSGNDPGDGGAFVASYVRIEITNADALISEGANPLWLAARLWMAVRVVEEGPSSGVLPSRPLVPPKGIDMSPLWRRAFLCRMWQTLEPESISPRWTAAQLTANDLAQGKLFSKHQDIVKHWGPLLDSSPTTHDSKNNTTFNTSGAMPRIFKTPAALHYVHRPKLVVVRDAVKWSWES